MSWTIQVPPEAWDDEFPPPPPPGEKCFSCGERYLIVFSVPDEVWAKVKPYGTSPRGGLLCPECVDHRARAIGIYLEWSARVIAIAIEAP